jgi:acetyltransferase
MYHYRRNIELLYETPAELSQADPPLKNYLRRVIGKAIDDGQRLLRTEHALDFLKNYGIPSVAMVVVTDASRIVRKARELGFPVQMTVRYLYDDRADETVWVTSEREADGVCHEVKHAVARPPGATGTDAEVVIRRAADPGGYRLRLVSTRDPEFRTVIMLGPGEASSHEVSIGLPPLNQTLARRLLEGVHLLGALRSSETGQVALSRLEGILLGFSNLIVDFAEIERVELDLSVREPEVLVEDVKVAPSFERDGSSPYRHLVITPYPTHYVTSWRLPDGTEVLIRPVRPEDEPMSREMFSAVSGETLRVRFFNVVDVTHELLMRFCNIDYEREIAVLAEIRKADRKIMIGGSRLIGEPDSKRGQFAVLVHDDYQGIGLGSKLIDVIIGIAQEKGLHEIHGLVLSENDRMLGLCRKLGFEVRAESDGLSRVILSLRDR